MSEAPFLTLSPCPVKVSSFDPVKTAAYLYGDRNLLNLSLSSVEWTDVSLSLKASAYSAIHKVAFEAKWDVLGAPVLRLFPMDVRLVHVWL